MGLLKLPKYVELPGGVAPVIGCKPGDIAPLVILTNFRDHVRRSEALLDEVTFKTDAGWEVSTITGTYRGTPVTVSSAGIGAGQTANVLEELINLGGKIFIQIGATGAIQERIAMGDVVIPTAAVRDEGTTRYYAPKKYPAVSDYRVVAALARRPGRPATPSTPGSSGPPTGSTRPSASRNTSSSTTTSACSASSRKSRRS